MRFEIRIRWRALIISVVGSLFIAGLYLVIDVSIKALLGTPTMEAALWFTRIWFGVGALVGAMITRTYTSNADTEVWQMEEIELSKRISAYEAEKQKRQEEKKRIGLRSEPKPIRKFKKEGSGTIEE